MKTGLAGALVMMMAASSVLAQQSQMYDDRPKISVSGEAVVSVKPDKVVVSFGIETWSADIRDHPIADVLVWKRNVYGAIPDVNRLMGFRWTG